MVAHVDFEAGSAADIREAVELDGVSEGPGSEGEEEAKKYKRN